MTNLEAQTNSIEVNDRFRRSIITLGVVAGSLALSAIMIPAAMATEAADRIQDRFSV